MVSAEMQSLSALPRTQRRHQDLKGKWVMLCSSISVCDGSCGSRTRVGCLCPASSVPCGSSPSATSLVNTSLPSPCYFGLIQLLRMRNVPGYCGLTEGAEVKKSTSIAYVPFTSCMSIFLPEWTFLNVAAIRRELPYYPWPQSWTQTPVASSSL